MLKVSVYAGFMQIFSGTYCGLSFFFSIEKNKKAKSCPTAQNKKFRHKKLPEAKLHNVVL
jgi:hypothetical protein